MKQLLRIFVKSAVVFAVRHLFRIRRKIRGIRHLKPVVYLASRHRVPRRCRRYHLIVVGARYDIFGHSKTMAHERAVAEAGPPGKALIPVAPKRRILR